MPNKHQNKKTPIIRLIRRQKQWVLTAQGWIVVIAFIATLTTFVITHIHPFLAVTAPIKADVLVVEGWLQEYALKHVITEFKSGPYSQIITTGVPLERGTYLTEYKNFAELSAATLRAMGLPQEKVIAVPAADVIRDRTYTSAVAFRQWLSSSNSKIKAINLYTSGVHARRSWLIFKKILAPKIKVGVIAAERLDYDPSKWWVSSAGVREIVFQTTAYIYARFINLGA